ncbi:hypothetical protein IJD34_00535 [bacterium]|nr:hypothetical protein [bacterium]
MRIHDNFSKTNFNGYKNILTFHTSAKNSNEKLSFLMLQLDNKGTADLENWKTLCRNAYGETPEEDILVIAHSMANKTNEAYVLNEYDLVTAKDFQENKLERHERYAQIKLYQFISDLTRRISNENTIDFDKNIGEVANFAFIQIQNVLKDARTAFSIVNAAALKILKEQKVAYTINQSIQRTMERALK